MFSMEEKQLIARKIEELLLSLKHPEMPAAKPSFHLKVWGAEDWSWADIDPNWTFERAGMLPSVNVWNEISRKVMPSGGGAAAPVAEPRGCTPDCSGCYCAVSAPPCGHCTEHLAEEV